MLKRVLVPLLLAACLGAVPATASAEQPYRDPAFSDALQTLLRAQWPNAYSGDEQALTGSAADNAVRRGLYHARVASKSFPDFPTMVGWFSWGATRDGLQVKLQRNFDARWFSFGGDAFGGATPSGSFDDARWWSGCPLIGQPTPGCELEVNGTRRPGWYLEERTKGLPGGQLGRIRILDATGAADCWFYYGDARCPLGQSVEEDTLMRALWLAQAAYPGTLDALQEIRCVFGNTYVSFPCFVKTRPLDAMDDVLRLERFETWKNDNRALDQVYPRLCTGCVYQVPDALDLDAARSYLDGSGEEPTAARTWINARLRPSRTPLILIPGIQGTILNKNGSEAWPRAQTALDDILGDRWLIDLSLDPSGTAEADGGAPLVPIDLIGHIDVDTHIGPPAGPTYHKPQDHYNVTRDRLVAAGYVEGVDLFTFPFDWRKSAASNADRLLAKIEAVRAQTGAAKVDILAHSQGGLVTDALLSTDRADGKVRRVLTLGTPVLGAPKAFGVIAYRTPCLVALPFVGSCVHDPRTVQEILRNMPGAYELLPTATLQAMEGAAWTVGGVAESPAQLDAFVGNGANPALVGQARAWQSTIDAFRPHDPSVAFERIAGVGRGTIYGVDETTHTECVAWFFQCQQVVDSSLRLGDGDGTVPVASSALRLGADDRSRGIPIGYTSEADHDGLAHSDGVLAYAIAYFAQRTSPALSFFSVQRRSEGILSSPPAFAATEVETTGPATGAVSDDAGHALGPKADLPAALVLDDIPGGSYEEVGRTRSYIVVRPGSYIASFRVTGTRPVRILLRKHTGSTLTGQAEFVVAAPVPGETVRLAYGLDSSLDDARLEVDTNGDGAVDERVAPLGVVSGAAVADTTPASSEAGATAADGGQALVTLAAEDTGGAGLARIVYRVGDGQPVTYAAPFLVPLGSTVEYRSIDRAGNVEPIRRLVADDAPNTRRFANELQDGDKLRRFIDPQGDEDWFRFVLAGPASIKAQLNGLPADYDLELVDSRGAVVAAPAQRGKESEEIKAQIGAGTWFLHVSGYGGAWDRDHPYELKLQLK